MASLRLAVCIVLGATVIAACSSDGANSGAQPTTVADITPITRVEDAKPGVFIPPFVDCRPPLPGEKTEAPSGKVCTPVSIAGATEPGKEFANYAACDIVRTQRPYYPSAPAAVPDPQDPRLDDPTFKTEVEWARVQVAATGCVCCHDSRYAPRGPSQWDISAAGVWLDTVSDSCLALFAGLADSSVLGAFPVSENNGFDRMQVGVPSTDPARMRALVEQELMRRGVSEEDSRKVPPFGGPIYESSVRPPTSCGAGEGVAPDGHVFFKSSARYVYVLENGSNNPGVPPNLDRPAGTLFRLDVLASQDPIESGTLTYGSTPQGSFQVVPAEGTAPALQTGKVYQLTALRDVGVPVTNCTFVFGEPVPTADPEPMPSDSFGAKCGKPEDCSAPAVYCAVQPGQTEGYCTASGCKEDASRCPGGWGCFDTSMFQPGGPSFCSKP
ncbi:MAG TPA: hypothetical protein VFQ61_03660 [Polyangiaceae bacterium]|nr:hypothetical protein [Polyangiaceae bacterium]